jgi:hypothetical protein
MTGKSNLIYNKGHGLRNINNRIKVYNGHWEIQANNSSGTTISFYIPINNLLS